MSLSALRGFLRHRWWIIVIVALLCVPVAIGLHALRTDKYSSQATMYISVNQVAGESANPYQASLTSQQMVKSYAELVTNPAVTDQVAERLGPSVTPTDVEDSLTATAAPNSVLLDIKATNPNPRLAQSIAESAVSVFEELVARTSTPAGQNFPLISANVVAPPAFPTKPVGPGVGVYAAAGLVAGLALGTLLAFVIHASDRRLRSGDDISHVTTLPQLGSIPEDKHLEKQGSLDFASGYSRTAEAFRTLRTNLQFCAIDENPRVIQITSALASTGKSVTSLNLARALAELGEDVCLFEADLRRPRLTEYLGLSAPVGLTTVLRREAELDDVTRPLDDGITLLPAGPTPPNPAEIIGSHAMADLLAELRTKFSYVIVDSAPVLPVTDAALLSRAVDGTVLITRWNNTTRENLAATIDSLEKVDAKLLGVVMNMSPQGGSSSKYQNYYDRVDAYSPKSPDELSPTKSVEHSTTHTTRGNSTADNSSTEMESE